MDVIAVIRRQRRWLAMHGLQPTHIVMTAEHASTLCDQMGWSADAEVGCLYGLPVSIEDVGHVYVLPSTWDGFVGGGGQG